MTRSVERALDPLMWSWCWLAYRMTMFWPYRWHGWLLPFAGYYAYHEPGMSWRWSERVR